ncbi:hypothetical protein GIB67_038871 [Kingdonia uniflora]|uniref:Uncharacterized protein n=1 Tax=Kingdonia uniflora TaxID=39325 RepID=A0A7J7P0W3_9MAGN|nr:hypothetical protein GIB67_038871 [Kingdonia uniflora]
MAVIQAKAVLEDMNDHIGEMKKKRNHEEDGKGSEILKLPSMAKEKSFTARNVIPDNPVCGAFDVGNNDFSNKNLRKAARWECCGDNYLYFERIQEIQDSDQEHFQMHWINGEPVIVGDALDMASGLSCDPMILTRALRKKKTSKVFKNQQHREETASDCLLWSEVDHPIHDQTFYLTSEHKKKLHNEYGIEPWSFVQKLKEAVLIPAGCCAGLFNKAAQISPDDADVHIVLCVRYNLSKEYDKVIGSFQTALKPKLWDYSLWNKLGAIQG